MRKLGGFCFHMYKALSVVCLEKGIAMKPPPFVTSKRPGKIGLRIGKGYSTVAKFVFNEDTETIDVAQVSDASFPNWLDHASLTNMISAVFEELSL